ncbi:hypothetical protein [Agriterribacter sp.]|uniref:hypothetical protein n=1 Tax=Agriterribacter sp. TaxID=2821509 RepID=UPI002B84EBC0|nr:hypothetical protein [Agriterribacter sp.]HRO45678.1 hypothetical protein [Agriterribacter sp.]HRQ15844.1 hypothetical protein [Agriterribacter sp.]
MKWTNELYNHEVNPPVHVWERVVHDLDNELLVFRNRLYDVEITPPENSWELIRHTLDTPHLAAPKSFGIKKGLRIAAAAALIGICFFAANYFIAGSDQSKTTGQKTLPANKTGEQPDIPSVAGSTEDAGITAPESNKPMIASQTTTRKNKTQPHTPLNDFYREAATFNAPPVSSIPYDNTAITDRYDLDHAAAKRIRNLKGEVKEDVRLMDLPNSYFLMTGPNGQSVRVSSKFRNTIQYLNGSGKEELLDVILRESQYWRNQFKAWKEEVGHSTFIPSAENFMDISELMKLLQQHNNK